MATVLKDDWTAVRSAFAGEALDTVFRFRTNLPPPDIRARYQTMLVVRWPYEAKKDGMPGVAVRRAMSVFEDLLEAEVEAPLIGIQAACLTGGGRRSWRYFVENPELFLARVDPIFALHGPSNGDIRRFDDPGWEGLADLMPLLGQ